MVVPFFLTERRLKVDFDGPRSEERFTHIAKFALEEVLLESPGPLDFVLYCSDQLLQSISMKNTSLGSSSIPTNHFSVEYHHFSTPTNRLS